jgi:hypothetical protein
MKIVKTMHQHYLGVNLDTEMSQAVKLLSYVWELWIPEDLAAQPQIGSMHGYVERAEPLFPYSFPILLAPIGKGYKVPPEKGVTVIVILDIEAAPHPRGQLIHEAKGATVLATAQAIEDHLLEIEAQILPIPSSEPTSENLASPPDYKLQLLLGRVEAVIDDIPQPVAIDREEFIAWQEPRLLRWAPLPHRGYDSAI